jgi:hypothetical protein
VIVVINNRAVALMRRVLFYMAATFEAECQSLVSG